MDSLQLDVLEQKQHYCWRESRA